MKSITQIVASRKLFNVLLLGFSSGIPLALTGATLQAWLTQEKVDLTLIGIFSLVGMPYTLKFLWAPLMDRFTPPILGRRRGWILVTQILLILAIAAMGLIQPAQSPSAMAVMAFFVAFFSASQDIVIDAYRTEVLDSDELGMGASNYILGYRLAMLVSGALALILADHVPWSQVYLVMAATMLVGVIASLWSPEPKNPSKAPPSLSKAVVEPFVEFFKRKGSLEILSFIVLYKMDVVFATAMMTPFLLQVGFTKTDIGTVTKVFGLIATIVGTTLGGILMTRLKMERSLWFFGIFQGVSGLMFVTLAHFGNHMPLLYATIGAENFCSGMGTAAYSAFIMSLCNKSFAATQYALLTSLMALTRVLAGAPTGYFAKEWGWETYFIVSTLLMIPGLLVLTRYKKWNVNQQ